MYFFIVNPKSKTGRGKQIWLRVKDEMDRRGMQYKAYLTHYEYHAIKIASEIRRNNEGILKIIILGGDGTVNEVLCGIQDYSKVFFGYIPSGSSNDLARSLKLPSDPLQALNRILEGKHYIYMDKGMIYNTEKNRQSPFIVSTGLGFDAAVCYEALNSNMKKVLNKLRLGKLTYAFIAIKRIVKHKPSDAQVIIDNRQILQFRKVFFIACMNHKYEGGGLNMAPSASYHDGKLDVVVIHGIPKIKILLLLPSLMFGWHIYFRGADIYRGSHIEIKTSKKMLVHADGEYRGSVKHLSVSCAQDQIRFIR